MKREIKGHFCKGAGFFFSAAVYFCQSGRIILERVGNTENGGVLRRRQLVQFIKTVSAHKLEGNTH
jgi:hypothetical protein